MSDLKTLLEELIASRWVDNANVYEAFLEAEKSIFFFKTKNRLEMPRYRQYKPKGRLKDILKEALEFWKQAEGESDKMKKLRLMRKVRDCLIRAYFITRPKPVQAGGKRVRGKWSAR